MEFLRVIVFDLLSSAPILVGVIALTGLLLQKESFDKVISGTLKTIVGFLVFGVGSAAATEALDSFQKLFADNRSFTVSRSGYSASSRSFRYNGLFGYVDWIFM